MLKSKHIDRLCLAVIGVAVLVTLAFMNGERFGLAPASAEPGYATRLFDASRVHTIDIEIDDWQAFLAAAPEEPSTGPPISSSTANASTTSACALRATIPCASPRTTATSATA